MWEGEKFMEKQWEKCFNWKKIIVCPVSAGIVFFCIFGLYKINSLYLREFWCMISRRKKLGEDTVIYMPK